MTGGIWKDVPTSGSITAVSYGGTALTRVASTTGGLMSSDMWYLINPPTGTAQMSVTINGNNDAYKLSASTWTGVLQTSPLDSNSTNTGWNTVPSATTTTASTSDVVIATVSRFSATDGTSPKTSIYNDSVLSTLGAASYQMATSAAAYSDSYPPSTAADWSMVIAGFRPATTTTQGATTTRYILPDHLGGTTIVTDTTGAITETLDYYPYGATKVDTKVGGFGGEKRKYIGQESDSMSGLNYLNARYQNGTRGQFISEDPVFLGTNQTLQDPQSMNSYSYANNNPLKLSDPTGKASGFAPSPMFRMSPLVGNPQLIIRGLVVTAFVGVIAYVLATLPDRSKLKEETLADPGPRFSDQLYPKGGPSAEDPGPNNLKPGDPKWKWIIGIGGPVLAAGSQFLGDYFKTKKSFATRNTQAFQAVTPLLNSPSIQTRYEGTQGYNNASGSTRPEDKLWVTPGGTVIDWYGTVYNPAPQTTIGQGGPTFSQGTITPIGQGGKK